VPNPSQDHTACGVAAMANGYASAASVWQAVRMHPGLAVIDAAITPRGSPASTSEPCRSSSSPASTPRTSTSRRSNRHPRPPDRRSVRLSVIGARSETAPFEMGGISTSQKELTPVFGDRVQPTVHRFALNPGVHARATAKAPQSRFSPNGMHAGVRQAAG
jgi:hypothetical protein